MKILPLEQSQDATLRSAFDQVIAIDVTRVQPDAVLTYPHFVAVRDRLYRVGLDPQREEVVTQLLVPRSRWEMIFQAANYNPMAGHLGYDTTLNGIMAWIYWPGVRAELRRWCASCPECQLVNPPAVPRAPLWPLPLVEAPSFLCANIREECCAGIVSCHIAGGNPKRDSHLPGHQFHVTHD